MIFASADGLSIAIQVFGGAGLIAGGYFILKDVVDFKLKVSDRVQTRLDHVEEDLEKCERRCEKYLAIIRKNNLPVDDSPY